MGVTVILPAHNEEMSISRVIDEVKALSVVNQVVVVDNASTDNTKKIALGKGITVLSEPRKGKGLAIRKAFDTICDDYYVMLDSDYTYPPARIPDVVKALKKYDAVACPRLYSKRGAMSPVHLVGNKMLTRFANLLYGTRISDLCSGMWGFRKKTAERLNLTSKGFTLEADILTNLVRLGCKVGEVPISYRPRLGNSKPKLRMLDGIRIAWFLLKRRVSHGFQNEGLSQYENLSCTRHRLD